MKITKYKNSLIIAFEYNPILIQIVRNFRNRKFDNKQKVWIVDLSQIKEVLEVLTPLGFKASREVLDEYNKEILKRKKINRILSGNFKVIEENLLHQTTLPFYNFQKIGVGFLCVLNSGLIADEPGLGKTIQSLGFVSIKDCNKILILCPNSLKRQWQEEILKWLPSKTSIIIKGTKKERQEYWNKNVNFYIANYELLLNDLEEIEKIYWDTIIADESTRISNFKAKRTKNIKKLKAKYKIALTGTPLSNNLQDIWSIIDFCFPGFLGTYWQFVDRYCIQNQWKAITGYKNLDELKKLLAYVMIKRLKKEVLQELPDRVYETIYVELTEKELEIYKAIKNELIKELEKYEIEKVLDDDFLSNMIVKMVRLRQATNSLELVSKHQYSSKVEALKELLLDILQNNKKAIIFTEFKEMANILYRDLSIYSPLLYTGDTSTEDRAIAIKMFNDDTKNKLLIMTSAGSEGLNIQRADYVIHFDTAWSIAKMEQREGRAHRIGQKNKIIVFRLIAQKTIDEYILNILHKKQQLSDELFETNKKKIKKLKISKIDIEQILK